VPVALAQQQSAPATDTQSPFLSVPTHAPDTLRFGAQLPDFEAKDINGRTWRFQDLRGKFTLICLWGTFGARYEDKLDPHARAAFRGAWGITDLPGLQSFYDKARNAKNIQVLTFCRDYDYTHAPDYMKQRKYTFPVIADWVLLKKLFPGAGSYLVVNPEGRLSYPFRYWSFGRILMEVERAAGRN
jgi:hypothetical protein